MASLPILSKFWTYHSSSVPTIAVVKKVAKIAPKIDLARHRNGAVLGPSSVSFVVDDDVRNDVIDAKADASPMG